MLVKQIYELVNAATLDTLGASDLKLSEDMTDIVGLGTTVQAIFNSDNGFDNYVHNLMNHVGRMQFVIRKYAGRAPSVYMDSWEFGSMRQKIRSKMPEATENETWMLVDGTSYDPNVFHAPEVSDKFWNGETTFEIDRSITEEQVKESFQSVDQLNAFVSMLFNEVEKKLTVCTDALIMRTIGNMVVETMYAENGTKSIAGRTGIKAVNLLYQYNQRFGKSLTAAQSIYDPEFIRYAVYEMGIKLDQMENMSVLHNVGATEKFTPKDLNHVILLSNFKSAAGVYLQSDTFHDAYVALPNSDSVSYWQGSGKTYSFDDISKINLKSSGGHTINVTGVIGMMFDRDALGVTRYKRTVKTNYNPKAEFTNYFYKQKAGYFNDLDENFVFFYVA